MCQYYRDDGVVFKRTKNDVTCEMHSVSMASTFSTLQNEGKLWLPKPWEVLESFGLRTSVCKLRSCAKCRHKQGLHRPDWSTFVSLANLSTCSCFTAPTQPFCFTWATPLFCPLTGELFSRVSGAPVLRGLLLTGFVSAGVRGRRPVLRGLSLTRRSTRAFLRGVRVTGDCGSSAAVIFLLVGVKTFFKKVTLYNQLQWRCF